MPTWTLLGATGGTGSAVLRYLLERPPADLTLRIFIRSKSKLLKAFPNLETTAYPNHLRFSIVEGVPSDQTALQKALENAEVVFQCIATNDSSKPTTLCYDTVNSILDALRALREREGSECVTPTVLMLRSLSLNEEIDKGMPRLAHHLLMFALGYVYADLDRGCKLLERVSREQEGLCEFILEDPGALRDDDRKSLYYLACLLMWMAGALMNPDEPKRTGHELVVKGTMDGGFINYSDLGAGIVEIAERREEFKGKAVGIGSAGYVKQAWGPNISNILWGLKGRTIG